MLLLAINSATTFTEVTLIQDNRTLFEKSWPSRKDEAEKILETIQEAFEKSKVNFTDLDQIFVVSGPGSFSGLRIGVTIANALAFSKKIPIFSCSTFDLLRSEIIPEKRKNTAIIISGGVHFALLLPNRKKTIQLDADKLADLLHSQKKLQNIFADLHPLQFEKLQQVLQNLKKIKLLPKENLQTFSSAVKEILKVKTRQSQKIVAPCYFEKPHITLSKKQVFA